MNFKSCLTVTSFPDNIGSFINKRALIAAPDEKISGNSRVVMGNPIYLEKGEGKPIIFLHVLIGGIFNYIDVFQF